MYMYIARSKEFQSHTVCLHTHKFLRLSQALEHPITLGCAGQQINLTKQTLRCCTPYVFMLSPLRQKLRFSVKLKKKKDTESAAHAHNVSMLSPLR
jgi:hypothetical protein